MMQKLTKSLAVLLALLMAFGVCAVSASAADDIRVVVNLPIGELFTPEEELEELLNGIAYTDLISTAMTSLRWFFIKDPVIVLTNEGIIGAKIGQEVFELKLKDGKLFLEFNVVENQNYRVFEEKLTIQMLASVSLEDLIGRIGYTLDDLDSYYCFADYIATAVDDGLTISEADGALMLCAGFSLRDYEGFVLLNMKDGKCVRVNVEAQQEKLSFGEILYGFSSIMVILPVAMTSAFTWPFLPLAVIISIIFLPIWGIMSIFYSK